MEQETVDERLHRIEGKLDTVIGRFEASQRREGEVADYIADLKKVATTLANAQQRQHLPPLFVVGVLIAGIVGGLTALAGRNAFADKPDVHHSRGE